MLYVVRISGRRNVDGHRTYGSLPDSAFFHSFVCQTSLFQLKIVYQVITWFENFKLLLLLDEAFAISILGVSSGE